MAKFDLSAYEEVKDRLPKFYKKYPDGRVITSLEDHDIDYNFVLFKAMLFESSSDQVNKVPLSTGWAHEIQGQGYINKTSHIENCETSAIGRALANLTFHGSNRPSKEEMQKVEKHKANSVWLEKTPIYGVCIFCDSWVLKSEKGNLYCQKFKKGCEEGFFGPAKDRKEIPQDIKAKGKQAIREYTSANQPLKEDIPF